jgi:phosphoribosylformylglycinamidine (FGAM) synthase PurS component
MKELEEIFFVPGRNFLDKKEKEVKPLPIGNPIIIELTLNNNQEENSKRLQNVIEQYYENTNINSYSRSIYSEMNGTHKKVAVQFYKI